MNKTNIDYLTHSWNPIVMRCTPTGPGCEHCWHLGMADRMAANPNFSDEVRAAYAGKVGPILVESRLCEPLKGKPKVIGVQFMGDLWHNSVPDEFIDQVFSIMHLASQHRFMILTKRAERMYHYMEGKPWSSNPADHASMRIACLAGKIKEGVTDPSYIWPLPNVMGMVTVENQETAAERIPWLLKTPFAMRGVSVEPMLGAVDLENIMVPEGFSRSDDTYSLSWNTLTGWRATSPYSGCDGNTTLDLVIAGGESGSGARPMHPDWARGLRNQCQAAGIPFFFKQWGEWRCHTYAPERGIYTGAGIFLRPDGVLGQQGNWWNGQAQAMDRVGKKKAGHLLDGEEWHQMPEGMKF